MELLLTSVFFRLPELAIYVVGLVLARSRRQTLGRYWLLIAAGCAVSIATWIASTALFAWQMIAINRGVEASNIGLVWGILQNLLTVISAVGVALILAGALRLGPRSFAAPPATTGNA
jgi:hypothetical protein